ncbi:MAG: iron-containing redox enzyme family protein [Kofleriaceae bacterium]
MRFHLKQYTEPIFESLVAKRAALMEHPLLAAARTDELSTEILHEFAFHQYSDSILWIPMLAQMKAKAVRSERLRRAIEDNIAHEAGIGGISHVTLAVELIRSLGIRSLDPFPTQTFARSATMWLSDEFVDEAEPATAGWLLVAESLVPAMFEVIEPCFARLGANTRYFKEHVHVDSDEHARWMAESVEDVLELYGPDCAVQIAAGMEDAFAETLEVPNALWRRS